MTPGPIARGCYASRIAKAGPSGLSRTELSNVSVPGLGPLRAADRDAVLAVLLDMGRIEKFTHKNPRGPAAVCYRERKAS